MPRLTTGMLAKTFAAIEAAAVAGERCPQNYPHGPIHSNAVSRLYVTGRIRGEIYRYNYRVIVLLDGPHKGKRTAPPAPGLKPYKVVGG